MRRLVQRSYFFLCLALGRLLRASRYTAVRIVPQNGNVVLHKKREFYAPPLIRLAGLLFAILNTGVRVLPQREWEVRERAMWQRLRAVSIRVDAGGVLVFPLLAGHTLAALLEDPALSASRRRAALVHAVTALAELHREGFTHGDAMAENVFVDLEAGGAHWLDFETAHDSSRPIAWRRADDLRALIDSCVRRTATGTETDTIELVLRVYADEAVTSVLRSSFTSVWQRALIFHLAQAPLSFQRYQAVRRIVGEISVVDPGGSRPVFVDTP